MVEASRPIGILEVLTQLQNEIFLAKTGRISLRKLTKQGLTPYAKTPETDKVDPE